MTETIGFVGLGVMGSRMAHCLLNSGHSLLVYDKDEKAVAKLVDLGASRAASPADVAGVAGTVFCSLPSPSILHSVILGDDGLVHGTALRTVVDLSTTGTSATTRIAAELATRGIGFLDSPVSGGATAAAAGSLTLMVSGEPSTFEALRPLLDCIGKNIFFVGDKPGQGQSMKLVNNLLFAANAIAAFEVLVMGAKAGLDPNTVLDIINVSSGRSFITTNRVPDCVLDRSFPQRFATELLFKDVKLGIDEAEAMGASLHMAHAAQSFLAGAMDEGGGPLDCANLIKHFERAAGVEFGSESAQDKP